MVTIYKKNDVFTSMNKNELELRGLSTDEKPTTIGSDELENGTTFIEMDTGNIFFYDANNKQWKEV